MSDQPADDASAPPPPPPTIPPTSPSEASNRSIEVATPTADPEEADDNALTRSSLAVHVPPSNTRSGINANITTTTTTTTTGNDHSENSDDDISESSLLMMALATPSSYLHTIPEGDTHHSHPATTSNLDHIPTNTHANSSDVGGGPLRQSSRSSSHGSTNSASSNNNSAWMAMMRKVRGGWNNNANSSQNNNNATTNSPNNHHHSSNHLVSPRPPPSVTSSTRAVEAGHTASSVAQAGAPSSLAGQVAPSSSNSKDDHPHHRHKHKHPHQKQQKLLWVAGLACILVIAVIVAMILIVQYSRDEDSNNDPASMLPDDHDPLSTEPTMPPTFANCFDCWEAIMTTTNAGEDSMENQLDQAMMQIYTGAYSPWSLPFFAYQVFEDVTAPQYQAREWMLTQDTLWAQAYNASVLERAMQQEQGLSDNDAPCESCWTSDRIVQRYIMSVFYFANSAAAMDPTTSSNEGNGDDSGTRKQLLLRGRRRLDSSPNSAIRSTFVMDPNLHECFWIDNGCGQDDDPNSLRQDGSNLSNSINATALASEEIRYLKLPHAGLVGQIPFELGYMTNLRELSLTGNHLTGTLPTNLFAQWNLLYYVDVSDNKFSGEIPELWTLPILRFVYFHNNSFTGPLPQYLRVSTSSSTASEEATTQTPETDPNQLQLPTESPTTTYTTTARSPYVSPYLEEIWLWNNQLSGELPQWLAYLPRLARLRVNNNTFTGPLPGPSTTSAGAGQFLQYMDVSLNRLTGTLPPTLLYGMPRLEHLYLDHNNFSGNLPTFDNLEREEQESTKDMQLPLKVVWLNYNWITGQIPDNFGVEWQRLEELELHDNFLEGVWDCDHDDTDGSAAAGGNNRQLSSSSIWPRLRDLGIDCLPKATLGPGESLPPNDDSAIYDYLGFIDMSVCGLCCTTCH